LKNLAVKGFSFRHKVKNGLTLEKFVEKKAQHSSNECEDEDESIHKLIPNALEAKSFSKVEFAQKINETPKRDQ